MTDSSNIADVPPAKAGKKPLLIGVLLGCVGLVGGYFAVSILAGPEISAADEAAFEAVPSRDAPLPVFVALEPLIISLSTDQGRSHLRFSAQIEVAPGLSGEVEALKPRIIDILNGYLRAVEIEMLNDPSALQRMRSQMLRRVQVVAGEGRIKDLLIMEFVLS
ncbi:flagellar basal body-associated FliL family protein [Yoonia litorea]|uniref:Flagellar protein FliL n=1 Tax=Yoonia litorea TaxID=1123755 RepID=A0A1I6MU66_9RHOB|nr:flagellar basal body-associated FliL family protein [Yoonia litorea]SFS19266.1 flagellar FliL protein [Yoonia litorea]